MTPHALLRFLGRPALAGLVWAALGATSFRPVHARQDSLPQGDRQAFPAPAALEGELVAEVPLEVEGSWLIVPVRGRGKTFRFIFDTGSSSGSVSESLARRHGLRAIGEARLSGASGRDRVSVVDGWWLRLGSASTGDREKFVLGDDVLSDGDDRRFDGIIGTDLLRRYDVLIDAPAGLLRLYRPGTAGSEGGPVVGPSLAVPFERLRRGIIQLEVSVNGHPVAAVLDTGSPTVLLNPIAADAVGLTLAEEPLSEGARGVGSKAVTTYGGRVDAIQVGETRFESVDVEVADLPIFGRLGLGGRAAMLLGSPVLLGCPLLISYKERALRFCRLSPAPDTVPESTDSQRRLWQQVCERCRPDAADLFAPLQPREAVPAVRTVTAFLRLDREAYRRQLAEGAALLRRARSVYEAAGYEVQTVRIATQPFPEYAAGLTGEEALSLFRELDAIAAEEGFILAIGPAMHAAGAGEAAGGAAGAGEAELLVEILSATSSISASLTVADERGVRWDAVAAAAGVMRGLADRTPGGERNFGFAAAAVVAPHTPFFPAAYHDGSRRSFAVGLQSANVVRDAFRAAPDPASARAALTDRLGEHARAVELLARRIQEETGWGYLGIDLSPAPLGDVSIGAAIESFTGVPFGSPGTLAAAALVTDALGAIDVKATGYSGLMIPVLEDEVLARRWTEGVLTLEDLLAYSSVCAAGLDTVPLPGDATVAELERIIGDIASLAVKLRKPLTARLIPVPGKRAGQQTEFHNPLLTDVKLQPLH